MSTEIQEGEITVIIPDNYDYADLDDALLGVRFHRRWWNSEWFDPIELLEEACNHGWDLPSAMMYFFEDPAAVGFTMHGLDEGYGDPMYASITGTDNKEERTVQPVEDFVNLFRDNPSFAEIAQKIREYDGWEGWDT